MKQTTIVTNLRMEEQNYLMVKTIAAEMGVSVNEFLNSVVHEAIGRKQLGVKSEEPKIKEDDFWNIPTIMNTIKRKPMKASKEDKIIYGIK